MPRKIRTSGDMRAYLAELMVDVQAGKVNIDKASQITKMAAQVHESLYSEVKIARLKHELSKEQHKFGDLDLGGAPERVDGEGGEA